MSAIASKSAAELPRILFFNINGVGMGHLSRCLAYARRVQGRAKPVFFSLASAMDVVYDMGFEGDYFVSEFWSRSHINAWNRELAIRVGLMLEEVRPAAAVFDGTWPFSGFLHACDKAAVPVRVWSNRGLHKKDLHEIPVKDSAFDLVIEPGELGAEFIVQRAERPGRKVTTPPVALLRQDEFLDREEARDRLGLERHGRYALLSLGAGNLKDVSDVAGRLLDEVRRRGFTAVWVRTPISARDVVLPDDVLPISVYPLARFLRAFDILVSAAGYNACCEIVQAGIPSLVVPNATMVDDQAQRAKMLIRHAPVVVSSCETVEKRQDALERLLTLKNMTNSSPDIDLDGADRAADELLSLIAEKTEA